MKDNPLMIVAAEVTVTDQIYYDMREQHPSHIHQIGTDDDWKFLLSALEYDSEQQLLKDVDLSKSILVEGDRICSLLQYSEDSFMICGEK